MEGRLGLTQTGEILFPIEMRAKIGHDRARMEGDGREAPFSQLLGEACREKYIRGLALAISTPSIVELAFLLSS